MHILDLSVPIHAGMELYPGDPKVTIEIAHTYESHGWLLRQLAFGSHTGTHVDAPSHMTPNGATLSELPIERFMGRAVRTTAGAEHPHGVGLLFASEVTFEEHSRIAAAEPTFVGGALGERLERALLKRGIITYTGLANLDQLPHDRPFTFIALPLPIVDGDGSPVRAVALIDAPPHGE